MNFTLKSWKVEESLYRTERCFKNLWKGGRV